MSTKRFFHNTYPDRPAFSLQSGSRPWYALIILYNGSFSFTMGEQEFVIRKNEVAFFPKDVEFSRTVLSPISFHQFGFHADADEMYLPEPTCGKLRLPEEYTASVLSLLNTMDQALLAKRNRIYQNVIDNLLMSHHVFSAQLSPEHRIVDPDVAFTVEYMSEHLNEKLSIGEIAQTLHLTHTGLIGKFKRVHGCTPNEYLVALRMRFAKKLIAEGQLRINEISAMCGYSNAYYFSNAFRNFCGVTPSEYRESHKPE